MAQRFLQHALPLVLPSVWVAWGQTACQEAFFGGQSECGDDVCGSYCQGVISQLISSEVCTAEDEYTDGDGGTKNILEEVRGIQSMCSDPCGRVFMSLHQCVDMESGATDCNDECVGLFDAGKACVETPVPDSDQTVADLSEMFGMMCEPCMMSFTAFGSEENNCWEDPDCSTCLPFVDGMYENCDGSESVTNPDNGEPMYILATAAYAKSMLSHCETTGGGDGGDHGGSCSKPVQIPKRLAQEKGAKYCDM